MHKGKTREGSKLDYVMTSVLLYSKGVCEIWAVRAVKDNYPVDHLGKNKGQTLSTCQALGFIANDKMSSCKFGDSYPSNCGFPIKTSYYRYGTGCTGCTKNNGYYKSYVLQGYMHSASVISTMNGKTRSRCKVK